MKKKTLITLLGVSIYLISYSVIANVNTLQGDDVDGMELQSIIVEGWETQPWSVQTKPSAPEAISEIKLVDGRPKNLAANTKNQKSLGLKFRFVYNGNNAVYIRPAGKKVIRHLNELDEENKPRTLEIPGIELPGKVKAISVWVLGRGNEYDLEGWIEDWKGDVHIYKFGDINFIGWRPMVIEIPENVPQSIDSYPQAKTLIFKQFVLRSNTSTSSEEVVVFFDSLKVLTDVYDLYFDGADMNFDEADKKKKERLRQYESQLKLQQD